MNKRVSLVEKITMLVLLLAPILWIYGKPGGWSYEVICTLPLSIVYFLVTFFNSNNGGLVDPLPKGLTVYFIYWAVLYTLFAMQLPISMIQTYLTFFLFFSTFKLEYFLKIYKLFALICIVFFFAQEITYQVSGVRISGILQFLPLHIDMGMSDFLGRLADSDRSSSFFSEPAHLAQFLLPLLAIELFYDKGKYHSYFAIIIGALLLLLRSGNGLLGMMAILLFLLPYYFTKRGAGKWLSFSAILLLIGIVGYYYINSDMGGMLLERQSELGSTYEGGNRSGFLRVWRGLYVYGDYSVLEKLLGCPNEATQLSHVYASGMQMADSAELYFNAFQKILLNTGIIGLGIFVFIIVRLWRGNSVCGKALLGSLVAISFISAIYMSHTMILFLVLAQSLKSVKNLSNYSPLITKPM